MAYLYQEPSPVSPYMVQRRDKFTEDGWNDLVTALKTSGTLYVGNLSFYTTEEQIYELFSKCGEIKRIIMGLNRLTKTPCGFAFVEYYNHEDAMEANYWINATKLDDRVIRADIDPGFSNGRQYGRGKSGGQVRDDYRSDYDVGRGGWGGAIEKRGEDKRIEEKRGEKRSQPDSTQPTTQTEGTEETEEEQKQKNPRFREKEEEDSD